MNSQHFATRRFPVHPGPGNADPGCKSQILVGIGIDRPRDRDLVRRSETETLPRIPIQPVKHIIPGRIHRQLIDVIPFGQQNYGSIRIFDTVCGQFIRKHPRIEHESLIRTAEIIKDLHRNRPAQIPAVVVLDIKRLRHYQRITHPGEAPSPVDAAGHEMDLAPNDGIFGIFFRSGNQDPIVAQTVHGTPISVKARRGKPEIVGPDIPDKQPTRLSALV